MHGVRVHVDHIKPRRLFPSLALVESNLQVLCEVCNHGKGNWDQTRWAGRNATTPLRESVNDGYDMAAPCWARPRLVTTKRRTR